jgi:hypothetical protein
MPKITRGAARLSLLVGEAVDVFEEKLNRSFVSFVNKEIVG